MVRPLTLTTRDASRAMGDKSSLRRLSSCACRRVTDGPDGNPFWVWVGRGEVEVVTPGLYLRTNVDEHGRRDETYFLVWLDVDVMRAFAVAADYAVHELWPQVADLETWDPDAVGRRLQVSAHKAKIAAMKTSDPDEVIRVNDGVGDLAEGSFHERRAVLQAHALEVQRLSAPTGKFLSDPGLVDLDDSRLAILVYRRFGNHLARAATAWNRLMMTSLSAEEFGRFIDLSPGDEKTFCLSCGAELGTGEAKVFVVCEPCWDKHVARVKATWRVLDQAREPR